MMKRIFKQATLEPCRVEVAMMKAAWGRSPRVTYDELSPHREVEDIILRGPDPNATDNPEGRSLYEMWQEIECVNWPIARFFPYCMQISEILQTACVLHGCIPPRVGRVILTKLPPGGRIYEHADEGPVPAFYRRFHACLQGGSGNIFSCADQVVSMKENEIWEVDVRERHAVLNKERDDRVHLIVDIERQESRRAA